jgi:putative addiction module component (TIGR02574 family)
MTREQLVSAVRAMPQNEQLDLIMDLWDDVEVHLPLSPEQMSELDRRRAADDADTTPEEDWVDLRGKLLRGEF